jgi:hypothetical protein
MDYLIKIYKPIKVDSENISTATLADVPDLVAFINSHAHDFNVHISESDFSLGKLKDLPLSSIYLYKENNKLIGVLGIADKSADFKLVIKSYDLKMRIISKLLKYFKKYSLPDPEQEYGLAFTTLCAFDDYSVFGKLLRHAYNNLCHQKTAWYLILGATKSKQLKTELIPFPYFLVHSVFHIVSKKGIGPLNDDGVILDAMFYT